jgi:hypothetical protein
MRKIRYYVSASSLGSYFNVGFNSPDEQFQIDLGNTEQVFDNDAQDRLDLGNYLEDAALNYFENKLGIKIESRNTELVELYGGKIFGKFDGKTVLDGKKTLVENKISNAKSYKFTENMGYIFQVQAYMMDGDFEQALLCGLYQGKPIYKIIPKDEAMIADIKLMTDFVVGALMGIHDFVEDFPVDLVNKYSSYHPIKKIEHMENDTRSYFVKLGNLNKQKAEIEKQIKELKDIHEDTTFEEGAYEDDFIKVSVRNYDIKGGYDIDLLSLDHPELNLSKYRKDNTTAQRVTIKIKEA